MMIERFKYFRGIGERRVFVVDTTRITDEDNQIIRRMVNYMTRRVMIPEQYFGLNRDPPIEDICTQNLP